MSKIKTVLFIVAVAAVLMLSAGSLTAAERSVSELPVSTALTNWNCSSIPHPWYYVCSGNKGCTGAVRTWSSCTMTCYVGDTSAVVTCTKLYIGIEQPADKDIQSTN